MAPSKGKSRAKAKPGRPVMLPGGAMQTVLEFPDPNPSPIPAVRRTRRKKACPSETSQAPVLEQPPSPIAGGSAVQVLLPGEHSGPQAVPFVAAAPSDVPPKRSHVNFNLNDEVEYISLAHVAVTETDSSTPPSPLDKASKPTPTSIQMGPFPQPPTTPARSNGQTPHRPLQLPTTPARLRNQTPRRSHLVQTPRSGNRRRLQNTVSRPFKAKHRSSSSDVYTFFEEREDGRVCTLCEKVQATDTGIRTVDFSLSTGSGVLRRHLYTLHLAEWVQACDAAQIKITNTVALVHVSKFRQQGKPLTPASRPRIKYTPLAFLDALAKCFAANDLSINLVESPEFRELFLMLRDDFTDLDVPHRTSVHTRLMELWEAHLEFMKTELQRAMGKVSFSTDIWSDPNLTPFMAVTAHWVDGKIFHTLNGSARYATRLRADLIGFSHIPGSHTGEAICTTFLSVLDRMKITERIGWVTVDNASNNGTFVQDLENELAILGIDFPYAERHIRCFPHIVNLACKAVLQAITNMDFAQDDVPEYDPTDPYQTGFAGLTGDPIANIRAFIRVARASSTRRQYFADVVRALEKRDLQLLRDVDTRWSSVLLMIDRAIILRAAIERFIQKNEFPELAKYRLNAHEWDALTVFKDILSVPHAFQQRLSAEKTPTLCYALPSFMAMQRQWTEQQDQYPWMSDAIQAGLDKLSDYRGRLELVPAYILSMAVNPNIKLQWYGVHLPEKLIVVQRTFLDALRPYYTPSGPSERTAPHATATIGTIGSADWADDVLNDGISLSTRQYATLEDEVTAYLAEAQLPTDIMVYWQDNQARYKTIFALAMDILPIQGSAVPCERIFSSAKETTTMRRNRIKPELMECLQMLKFSLKKGRDLDFTEGTGHNAELENLEELNDMV